MKTNMGQHTPFVCRKCGSTEIYEIRRKDSLGRVKRQCRPCTNQKNLEWETKHRDQHLARLRRFNTSEIGKAYQRYYASKIKDEVFQAYGNECRCCGENEPVFLTIDHIDGSGAAHKASGEIGPSGSKLYRWLKRRGFPKDNFQLLCLNCNRGKFLNRGRCPHEVWKLRLVSSYSPE
jgi:hypothetical protein